MEQGALDWSNPKLLDAMDADAMNGFGFQCSKERSCLYLGKIFLAKPDESIGYPRYEVNTEQVLRDVIIPLLGNGYTNKDLWCTDFIGHEYVTVASKHYNDIARIINTILSTGMYSFVTHNGNSTHVIVKFMPGETFGRVEQELKIIESVKEQHAKFFEIFSIQKYHTTHTGAWYYMASLGGMRQLMRHWNYATKEGYEFCSMLRHELGRKKASSRVPRMQWPDYAAVAQEYQTLHCGTGWSAFHPFNQEQVEKEEECMICLDKAATTLVLPCNCRVVCDQCSRNLGATPDKLICVQCRRAITHVAYQEKNELVIL